MNDAATAMTLLAGIVSHTMRSISITTILCLFLAGHAQWLTSLPAMAQPSQSRPADYVRAMSLPGLTRAQTQNIDSFFNEAQRQVNSGTPLPTVRQEYWTKVRKILNVQQIKALGGTTFDGTDAHHEQFPQRSGQQSPPLSDHGDYRVIANIPYSSPPDRIRVGDLYLPQAQTQTQTQTRKQSVRPAVLFIHGGGWVGGSKEQSTGIAQALARHGFVVFNVNYRLVGQGGEFPGNVADVRQALGFLIGKSKDWGIDTKRMAAMGGSAGGHLSMMVGYSDVGTAARQGTEAATPRLAAVVSWFGVSRLTGGSSLVDRYIGSREAKVLEAASPITYAGTAVPTLFVHGTADTMVPISQSQEMAEALRAKRIASTLLPIQGAQHGFGPRDWSTAVNASIAFLDEQFHSQTSLSPSPQPVAPPDSAPRI